MIDLEGLAMALFGKRRHDTQLRTQAFWRTPPIRSTDPSVLHQYVITCVARAEPDGRGMMAAGWTLWGMTGLAQHQAADFMRDGYDAWHAAAAPGERMSFLRDLFKRLQVVQPLIGPRDDIYKIPRHVVVPAADQYTLRAWACSEILELGAVFDRVPPELRDDVFDALAQTHPEFLPARSSSHLRMLREDRSAP